MKGKKHKVVEPLETPRFYTHGHVFTGPDLQAEQATCQHCGCVQGSAKAGKLCGKITKELYSRVDGVPSDQPLGSTASSNEVIREL